MGPSSCMDEQTRPQLATATCLDKPDIFTDVSRLIPDAVIDIRYFSADNFVGTRVDGYHAALAWLTRPSADALAEVAMRARREGLRLKLFDCYRPARAVAHFARWAEDLEDTRTKPAYYPDLEKKALFTEGYIAARSGHSRGSTLDLTLIEADSGRELDMGTPFDLFSRASWPGSEDVPAQARSNRRLLAELMAAQGFEPFFMEWWHFTLKAEPFPETYFDFPIE